MRLYQSGEVVEKGGKFIEVGHGGGKLKNARIVEVNDNEALPELKPHEITIEYKGEKRKRTRQHKWMRLTNNQ